MRPLPSADGATEICDPRFLVYAFVVLPSFRWLAVPAIGLFALGTSACSASASDDAARATSMGPSGGAPSMPPAASSLGFEPNEVLRLVPDEAQTLQVVAQPPGVYQVRFALLGDLADASLDRSEAVTSPDGRVNLVLTAPSKNALFSVRASIGSAISAQRDVSVSASGYATVEVNPDYAGSRSPPYWIASARTDKRCEDLVGNPPPDGVFTGQSLANRAPQIFDVPVGGPIAVTLRAAWFASGCVNLEDLEPEKTTSVTVSVKDRPLELRETNLDVLLGLDPPPALLDAFVAQTLVQTRQAFIGQAGSDVEALLDAMAINNPGFDAARKQQNWLLVLGIALRAGGNEPLIEQINRLMSAGVAKLSARDTFRGHLMDSGNLEGHGWLTLDKVAGIDAPAAGFPRDITVSWNAEPDDRVLLFAEIPVLPSKLLAALADAHSGAADVPSALSDTCLLVGNTLAGNGVAYETCDATCISKLCANALKAIWQRVHDGTATPADIANLEVSASGRASIDDHALPRGFQGSWVGALTHDKLRVSVGGPAQGSSSPPTN